MLALSIRRLNATPGLGTLRMHKFGSHGNQLELWAAVKRIPPLRSRSRRLARPRRADGGPRRRRTDQREAIRLRHLEGWTLAALAERFGRSESAVAGLLKRGLRGLRNHFRSGENRL
jgi:hypothetical protein